MITTEQLMQIHAEKLVKTGSADLAFTKSHWVAYKEGIKDAMDREPCRTCDKIKQDFSKETNGSSD